MLFVLGFVAGIGSTIGAVAFLIRGEPSVELSPKDPERVAFHRELYAAAEAQGISPDR